MYLNLRKVTLNQKENFVSNVLQYKHFQVLKSRRNPLAMTCEQATFAANKIVQIVALGLYVYSTCG